MLLAVIANKLQPRRRLHPNLAHPSLLLSRQLCPADRTEPVSSWSLGWAGALVWVWFESNEFCRKSAYDDAATTKNCDGSRFKLPRSVDGNVMLAWPKYMPPLPSHPTHLTPTCCAANTPMPAFCSAQHLPLAFLQAHK